MLDDNILVQGRKEGPQSKKKKQKNENKNMALLKHTVMKKETDSPASNRRRYLSGSSERLDRFQPSPLRKKDKIT